VNIPEVELNKIQTDHRIDHILSKVKWDTKRKHIKEQLLQKN
jgi:hypothetical protein